MSELVKHAIRDTLEAERVYAMPTVAPAAIAGEYIAADEPVKVAHLLNPFDPRECERMELVYVEGQSLRDLIPASVDGEWVASVNGCVVVKEHWHTYTLAPGDYVVLHQPPGRGVLRIVAMIAVAVLAAYTGGIAAGLWGTFVGAMVSVGVTVIGTMLVNALLPIKPVEPKLGDGLSDSSPTYGIDGPKNVSMEGICVPVCYGTHRMAGNIIEMYVENVDDTQMLYMLVNAGEGPVYSIDTLQLNDQPIDSFKNVEWVTRLGLADQEVIPWFIDAFTARNLSIKLDAKQGWTNYITPGSCDRLRLDFVCPNGIYHVNKEDGSLESFEVPLTIQYRKYGDTTWTPLADTSTVTGSTPTNNETTTTEPNPNGGGQISYPISKLGGPGEFLTDKFYLYKMQVTGHYQARLSAIPGTHQIFEDLLVDAAGKTVYDYTPGSAGYNALQLKINTIKNECGSDHASDVALFDDTSYYGPLKVIVDNLINYKLSQYAAGGGGGGGGGTSTKTPAGPASPTDQNLKVAPADQNPTYSAATTISGKSRSAVRRSFSSPKLEYARYEIQIKRNTDESTDTYTSDQVYISDINEITSAGVAYNHTALVGLKIKLTDQLNGVPTVTYLNHGRIVNVWDEPSRSWGFANSSNPAWVVVDMLIHWRYGGQLDPNRMDLEQFKDWAHYCDANGLQFNGVFDSNNVTWDQLQYVCRLGHAQLINVGTRWGVAIERADAPVMMFGVGNMVKGSFKLNWLPIAERANEVEVTYFDRTDAYKQKTIKVYDPALLTNGRPQRTASFTLFGCTDELTAVKEGMLALNLNKYILQTAELEASVDALACTVGSVVYVQHDMPDWAASGRTAEGSTKTRIKLDRTVKLDGSKTNKLLVLADSVAVVAGTIAAIDTINNYVTLNGYTGQACKRLKVGTLEVGARPATAGGGVYVDDLTGLAAGQAYTLYDVDVVQEVTIDNAQTGTGGPVDTIVVSGAGLSVAPPAYANFMVGPVERVKKPFRVKAISAGSDDLIRKLTLIQYDERAYTIDTSVWNGPGNNQGPGDTGYALSHVSNLAIYEEVFISGALVKNQVVLTWTPPQYGVYKGADIWLSVNGEPIKVVNSVVGANQFKMDADVGAVLTFRVVAYDMWDKRLPFDSAPEITYTVTGVSTTPPVPPPITGLDMIWQGRDCKIFWRINSSTSSYEFGSEPYGADSGYTDPNFQDYEVRVYHDTSPTSPTNPKWEYVRTEYVTAPSYIYTYEKNSADGINRHLKFEVRVRVRIGAPGKIASVTAYNPPPYIPQLFNKEPSFETCEVFYPKPTDLDFEGVIVYMDTVSPPAQIPENLIYDGPNTAVYITGLESETDYFVVAAGYDTFGKIGLQFTNPLHFKTGKLDVTELAKGIIGVDWLDEAMRERIDLIDGDMPGSVNARILGEAAARGAAITSESLIRQTAEESIAQKTDLVTAAIAGTGAAAVQQQTIASITAAGGLAKIQDALAVVVGNNHSAILSEQEARATADSALAQQITTLTATVNGKNRTFYQDTAPVSTASYTLVVGDIWIDTAHGNFRYIWNGTSWVPAQDMGVANRIFTAAIQFPPQSTSSYTLQVGDLWIVNNSNNPSDPNNGRIFTWNGAQWIETPNAQVAANTASLTQISKVVNDPVTGLVAQWMVRTDLNGYVTGFGLVSQQTPYTYADGHTGWRFTSEFEVLADKFSIRLPGYPNLLPFTVGTVNGSPRVVINVPAVIGDLTVQTLHIANGSISMANMSTDGGFRGLGTNYTATYFDSFVNSHTAVVPFFFTVAVKYARGTGSDTYIDVELRIDNSVIGSATFDTSLVPSNGGEIKTFTMACGAKLNPGTRGVTVYVRERGNMTTFGACQGTTVSWNGNKK